MTAKRIVACLDVRNGRVVKGRAFVDLRDAGDPAQLAARYCREGADEIVVLDVIATREERLACTRVVEAVAAQSTVPITAGGGVRSLDDVERLLRAGADKVTLNSAALAQPSLISQAAARYGSQCVVVAIDARRMANGYAVMARSASMWCEIDAREWARRAVSLGAGEIVLTSIDRDGTQAGYDLELLRAVSSIVDVPVVASGGASTASSFADAFDAGAEAALAAGVFHRRQLSIAQVKHACTERGVTVRP